MKEKRSFVSKVVTFVKENVVETAILGAVAIVGMSATYNQGHKKGVAEGEAKFCRKLVTNMLEQTTPNTEE